MFWHDIAEIKERLNEIERQINYGDNLEYKLDNLSDQLNELLCSDKLIRQTEVAQKTLDKFEDYMKNVDKLNAMINEFKGCISMARGALAESKKPNLR